MPRGTLDLNDRTLETYTLHDVDTAIMDVSKVIQNQSHDMYTVGMMSEQDFEEVNRTVLIPRKDDLMRVKREELDAMYERRDSLMKLYALKEAGVIPVKADLDIFSRFQRALQDEAAASANEKKDI